MIDIETGDRSGAATDSGFSWRAPWPPEPAKMAEASPHERVVLRRQISGRAVLEVFLAIILCAAIAAAIVDRHARSGDALAAAALAIVLLIARINPDRTAAWREKRARRHSDQAPRVFTARKRRAAGIILVFLVYLIIRPVRNAGLLEILPYSLGFTALILGIVYARKHHFVSVVRRLRRR